MPDWTNQIRRKLESLSKSRLLIQILQASQADNNTILILWIPERKKNQRRCSIVGLGKQNFWPIFCNSALPKTQCQFCECQIKAINDGAQLTVVSRCLPRRRPRWSFLFFLPPRIIFDWEPLSGEGGEENKMTFPAVWRTLPVLTMGDVDGDRDERWKQFFFLQI